MPPVARPAAPSRIPRRAALWALVLGALAVVVFRVHPAQAAWWVEVVVARDDVQVRVEPSGQAQIEHRIHLNVAGGPLYRLEIRGVDPDAMLLTDAYAVPAAEAQRNSLASAVPVIPKLRKAALDDEGGEESVIDLTLDEGNGLPRGAWLIQVRYRTDLAGRGLVRPDGALTHIEWTGARWDDGLDSTRATFIVPTAPTPPRAEDPSRVDPEDGAEIPSTFLSSLRREREHDELELLRPYAPRAEAVTWKLQVDRRALDLVEIAADKPADEAPMVGAPPRFSLLGEARAVVLFGIAGGVFVAFALLVGLKVIGARRAARAAGAVARPLVPLPLWARSPLAAASFVGGVTLQLSMKDGTWGSSLVAVATLLCAHRCPRWDDPALRGPGRWLVAMPREVFGRPPRPRYGLLDASTRNGKIAMAFTLFTTAGLTFAASRVSSYHATLAALDAVAMLSLFLTGTRSQLPPDPAVEPAILLRPIYRRLSRVLGETAKVAPRIRVPDGKPDADELRLLVMPRRGVAGLVGIEIGVVFAPGLSRALHLPEILVRARAGTEAEKVVRAIAPRGRLVRGRRPDEVTLSLSPRWPGVHTTADLTVALVQRLTGRAEVEPSTAAATPSTATTTKRRKAA